MTNDWILELKKEKLHKLFIINEELGSRISDLFLRQLQLGVLNDSIHVPLVVEEIHALEERGKSRTKVDSPFSGGVLSGLQHKHFFQTSLIGRNLQNEWKMQSNRSGKLTGMIQRIWKKSSDPLKLSEQIASEFVGALAERELRQDLDGEWIIFTKWNEQNYYLTLADHKEEDEKIRARILESCSSQFPFVREILGA